MNLDRTIPRLRTRMRPPEVSMLPFSDAKKKFRQLKKLDQGAFGIVFSAVIKNHKVIIKTVIDTMSLNEALEALAREIQILGKLQKFPFIPRLVEVGTDYFVQEDADGNSMLSLLTQKGLEAREIMAIVVASGIILSKLHREGIAHTDFNASNILLTPQGVVAIDFGLAADRSADGEEKFKRGIVMDLREILANLDLSMEAVDVPAPLRAATLSIAERYENLIDMHKVNEFTADDLARDLIFILAQLGAATRRDMIGRRQKIKLS